LISLKESIAESPICAMAADVASDFAATGQMTDMNRVLEVELFD
jgi:hypothetical protein